jgi:hypothetical protein
MVINWRNFCIWLVIYLSCTMMHGLTTFKFKKQHSTFICLLFTCFGSSIRPSPGRKHKYGIRKVYSFTLSRNNQEDATLYLNLLFHRSLKAQHVSSGIPLIIRSSNCICSLWFTYCNKVKDFVYIIHSLY